MVKALLKFFFVIVPFFILGGLELIILLRKEITLYSYETRNQKKRESKRQQEQKIIKNYLNRVLKENKGNK